ncbi:enoyl-CoA hydratase/isomerase family protein [Streptomyces sp. NPDC057253]|uniref:enoyl-CoA hydratase/isomerase family protein n=1 Tax=Streptomyces sp. NPDC057253 TaxID=3346069 RepID=UPI00364593C7
MTDATVNGPNHLRRERCGAAEWLVLDRPERRNALTVELVHDLADAVAEAGADPEVRALVVTGAAPAFCAGGDLAALSVVAEQGARAVTDTIYGQFQRLVRLMRDVPVPVIAAVGGAALGAGLDLALSCDLRYASQEASFASSWINVGLVPGMGGAHLLTRAVGSTRASEMVLTGRVVAPDEALAWGLVNEVLAADRLEERVAEVTAGLAKLSRPALSSSKASLRRALSAEFDHELAVLGAVQGGLLTGQEFRDATARFRRRS